MFVELREVTGIIGFWISSKTESCTLLSELGIMVSVIQEPNLDPDARTVMGLLTPVNFPQPGGQEKKNVRQQTDLCIYLCRHGCTVTL